jgi:hypothetical protein
MGKIWRNHQGMEREKSKNEKKCPTKDRDLVLEMVPNCRTVGFAPAVMSHHRDKKEEVDCSFNSM